MTEIVAAAAPLQEAGLALLYSRLPPDERDRQLQLVLAAARSGEIPLDDLLVARTERGIAGAILAVRREGRMAFVWPPVSADDAEDEDLAGRLLHEVCDRMDAAGILYTQCLLEPGDAEAREQLSRHGFPYCTDMLLLARPTARVAENGTDPILSAVTYGEGVQPRFVRVVERTFVGSLDCPALARHRRGAEMLAAHRATANFNPGLWSVFEQAGEDVGVLLSVDHLDRGAREILYLGVVPEARGRGIGRAMVQQTLSAAERAGYTAVEVAVDAGNRYAMGMYRELDFSVRRRMMVHLRLSAAASAPAQ